MRRRPASPVVGGQPRAACTVSANSLSSSGVASTNQPWPAPSLSMLTTPLSNEPSCEPGDVGDAGSERLERRDLLGGRGRRRSSAASPRRRRSRARPGSGRRRRRRPRLRAPAEACRSPPPAAGVARRPSPAATRRRRRCSPTGVAARRVAVGSVDRRCVEHVRRQVARQQRQWRRRLRRTAGVPPTAKSSSLRPLAAARAASARPG